MGRQRLARGRSPCVPKLLPQKVGRYKWWKFTGLSRGTSTLEVPSDEAGLGIVEGGMRKGESRPRLDQGRQA